MDHHHTTLTRPVPSRRGTGSSEVAAALGDLRTSVSDAVETFLRSITPARAEAPWAGAGYGRHDHHRHHEHDTHHDCHGHHEHDTHHDCHGHHEHRDLHEHHGHRDCEAPCKPDRCHCTCCVCDADLVVYARLGERRIVPIRIENERRREREIELDLSEFTTRGGGDAPVQGGFITPTVFTLGPCEGEDSILVIEFRPVGEVHKPLTDRVAAIADVKARVEDLEDVKRLPDVDDCLVAYADLRIEGCDVRPIRIAVALVPRDCGPYEVHCGCGCC